MNKSPIAYEHILNYLTSIADGKICLLISDKTSSSLLDRNVIAAFNALLGKPCRRLTHLQQPKQK